MPIEPEYLSMRNAARRVHRSRRTLQRWMRQGMPFQWLEGRKYIHIHDLLATYRRKLEANPTRRKITEV